MSEFNLSIHLVFHVFRKYYKPSDINIYINIYIHDEKYDFKNDFNSG